MKSVFCFLILTFSYLLTAAQKRNQSVDTVVYTRKSCPTCVAEKDTVIWRRLKCGLYQSNKGDLAFQTVAWKGEPGDEYIIRYINAIYFADTIHTEDGGIREMKYVVDTTSFTFLNGVYWKDKARVYYYNVMSDGGTIACMNDADAGSFVPLGRSRYGKDRNHVYHQRGILAEADKASFVVVEGAGVPELARDKNHFYISGEIATKEEEAEFGLRK